MKEGEIAEMVRRIGVQIMDIDMDLISDEQLTEIIRTVKKEEEENEKE